jgi:hypothetical protein
MARAATLLLALLAALPFPSDEVETAPLALKLRLVERINQDRKAEGRAPVEFSEELSRAADMHCRDMVEADYMSHWNRSGWKPYLRYAAAGIRDSTAENVYSIWKTHFDRDESQVWNSMLEGHRSFMAEKPPNDGHRRSILEPRQTHVGIGTAYGARGMRLIELFGASYAEIEPLPLRATLRDQIQLRGRVLKSTHDLMAVAVYYEPLPRPMSLADLKLTGSYSLPTEEQMERPELPRGMYADMTTGRVQIGKTGKFYAAISFWKRQPGVYTIGVWVRERSGRQGFLGAMTSILVEEAPKPATPRRGPSFFAPPPDAP